MNPRELPSDEVILEFYDSIPSEEWRTAYALMATYGLRNHECWHLDLEALQAEPGVAIVLDGKTGSRNVWPIPGNWWKTFNLGSSKLELPKLKVKKNSDYGLRSAAYFKRRGMPFRPYDLRHCWAIRSAVKGLDPSIAARMMGHSLSIHYRIYQRFINNAMFQEAWEKTNLN